MRPFARRLRIEGATVTRMVDILSKEGLVRRSPDPGDRRAWRLYLTDASRPTLDQMQAKLEAQIRINEDRRLVRRRGKPGPS